jgi:hypothetical protein
VYYFKYTCMGSFVLKCAQLGLAFSMFYHFSNLHHKLQTQLPTVQEVLLTLPMHYLQ